MHVDASFVPLQRVVAKYRSDVHTLAPPATADALTALEAHLGRGLPPGLRTFLTLHNGATLFRGLLRVRNTSEMTLASEAVSQVVLFADGIDGLRWGWARDGAGGHVFGPWTGDALLPAHGSFPGWLAAEIALLETRVAAPDDQAALRFEADATDPWQLAHAAERALRRGHPDEAEAHARRALDGRPTWSHAWQLLGDALAISDRTAARQAWSRAFEHTSLPLPFPGAPCLDPDVIRNLRPTGVSARGASREVDEWERALEAFLQDRLRDVASVEGGLVAVAAARELARSKVERGRRREGRDVLSEMLGRCRVFKRDDTPWALLLELAGLEVDLGQHDEAEGLLRRVRREAPGEHQGAALLLLARIAVTRQEPWAEEILDEADAAGLDDGDQVRAACLRVERAIRLHHDGPPRTGARRDEARAWLERAKGLVRRLGLPRLQALVALAEGDVARLDNRVTEAGTRYKRALFLLEDRDDPELRFRVHLRLGDLALVTPGGETREAEGQYLTAAQGFAQHQLLVREGWALLRLAQPLLGRDPTPLAAAARTRFAESDLAAGIAAVDALAGDPGASLAWHLDRATAHARARHDAQRSRPPWERADADRPERRLGAHRLAIAACDVGVVHALAAEMDANARAMAAGRARAADPPVLRYVAAVDLLAAHRSYEAAAALLRHLLHRAADGPARRALQGAIARSPNAALVDGLLSVLERAAEHPAPAVAEAAELLGLRRESAAVPVLSRLASASSNPIARKAAVTALGRIGDRKAVDAIVPALHDAGLAEQAALALLMLGDRRGVDFHGRALAEDRRDLSGSPGEIVGRYGGPAHLLLLINVASSDGRAAADDRVLGALQGLGLMGDPRGVPALMAQLESRDRRVAEVASGALTILTGNPEDADDPASRLRWKQYWAEKGAEYRAGVRYRDGRPMDAGLLLQRMEHHDPWTRRTAYDELVITTGESLPFDSDGPWRIQQAHLLAWRRWWVQKRTEMPAGRWYLDGHEIT